MVEHVDPPKVDKDSDLKMLVSQTESNKYFGKMVIGRIQQGKLSLGDKIQAVDSEGKIVEVNKVMKIVKKFGVHELDLKTAYAGDIISVAGITQGTVGNTLNNVGNTHVIPSIPIDPPMISFTVTYNDSPLKGKDGDKLTISQIRERLLREAEDDVSLRV